MYKLIYALTVTFLLSLGISYSLNAQCIACFQTSDGCSTESVDFDAYDACGCGSGCQCYGECSGRPGGNTLQLSPELDLKDIEVPEEGLKIEVMQDELADFLKEVHNGGYIGTKHSELVYFSEKIGFYRLNNTEFIAYPLMENKFDMYSLCDGEKMASIVASI